MCNEREDSVWFIHTNQSVDNGGSAISKNDQYDNYIQLSSVGGSAVSFSVSNNMFTKDDHATSGVNRKIDATLVDTIDEVYRKNWDLPEYLPFRECLKMGIQDGIEAGMKRSSVKYEAKISEKNKQLLEMENECKRWRNAFMGLLGKCREGIDALDFISRVVHGSSGKK